MYVVPSFIGLYIAFMTMIWFDFVKQTNNSTYIHTQHPLFLLLLLIVCRWCFGLSTRFFMLFPFKSVYSYIHKMNPSRPLAITLLFPFYEPSSLFIFSFWFMIVNISRDRHNLYKILQYHHLRSLPIFLCSLLCICGASSSSSGWSPFLFFLFDMKHHGRSTNQQRQKTSSEERWGYDDVDDETNVARFHIFLFLISVVPFLYLSFCHYHRINIIVLIVRVFVAWMLLK